MGEQAKQSRSFELINGDGYIVFSELESILKAHGGSLSCRVVVTPTGQPAWMFFYLHPTGVHLDVLAGRSAGPKYYWTKFNALNFINRLRPLFSVTDNPCSVVPELTDKPLEPGELRASPQAYNKFVSTFF